MKKVKTDELYNHLSEFLQSKGIELKDGSYAQRIQKGCSLLSEAINFTQTSLKRAKTGVDRKLDRMREAIHQQTAPKTSKPPGKPSKASRNRAAKPTAKKAGSARKNRKA
ncbi:MAG TPA: hypothetical protein P5186_08450 [Candidatus Paceibacterota bacterium]|nr:hypothetical protein [Verrucomicrobiota bacterium]HRY48062.1 hypothetical protein [Candidatus Paceibacterota bacterium]